MCNIFKMLFFYKKSRKESILFLIEFKSIVIFIIEFKKDHLVKFISVIFS